MDWVLEHIYELCIGLGLVLTTIFNRRKPTAEEVKVKNSKVVASLEKKQLKEVKKLQKIAEKKKKKKEE